MMGVIGEDRLETKPDAKSLEEFGTVETFQQVEMNRGCRFLFRLKPYVGEGEAQAPFCDGGDPLFLPLRKKGAKRA